MSMGLSVLYFRGSPFKLFKNIYDVFLPLKIFKILANSEDPDEMSHHAAFLLGFHCPSTWLWVPKMNRVKECQKFG